MMQDGSIIQVLRTTIVPTDCYDRTKIVPSTMRMVRKGAGDENTDRRGTGLRPAIS